MNIKKIDKKVKVFFTGKESSKNKMIILVLIVAVTYFIFLKKKSKVVSSDTEKPGYTNTNSGGKIYNEAEKVLYPAAVNGGIGSREKKAGSYTLTFIPAPDFEVGINESGYITDITSGIIHGNSTGTLSRLNGRNVFYQIGYYNFGTLRSDGTKNYIPFKDVKIASGVRVIRRFACDPVHVPDYQTFIDKVDGFPSGINKDTCQLSEVFLSIHADTEQPGPSGETWLKPSRIQLYHQVGLNLKADGTFATYQYNTGKVPADMHNIGINTQLMYRDNDRAQPNTFDVIRWGVDHVQPTAQQLYDRGRGWVEQYSLGPNSVIYDEIPENTQGTDPNISAKMHQFYKGAFDAMKQRFPSLQKKDHCMYGSYGIDDFDKNVDRNVMNSVRPIYEQSLTTHVHKRLEPSTQQWGDTANYYKFGDINYRHVNLNYYMYTDVRLIPYELCYYNERVKIGTKTFEGVDRESKIAVITSPGVQSLVDDGQGNYIGVEYTRSGEIIDFAGGQIEARNTSVGLWDENYILAYFATKIMDGYHSWGGEAIGTDTSSLQANINNPALFWNSSYGRELYQSGVHGAPQSSPSGLMPYLSAASIDSAYAGWRLAKQTENRSSTLYYASYSSHRGNFTAVSGERGLHLNGFGVLNKGLFVERDAREKFKALVLVGEGPAGYEVIYYNGFLGPHENDHAVTVNHNGKDFFLGSCYGRTLYRKSFNR